MSQLCETNIFNDIYEIYDETTFSELNKAIESNDYSMIQQILDTMNHEQFEMYYHNEYENIVKISEPEICALLCYKKRYFYYNADTELKLSYGTYIWCGNMNSPTGSGYTLCTSTESISDHKKTTYMLLLKIKMNDYLVNDVTFIDIYNNVGRLLQSNKENIVNNIYIFFNEIKQDMIDTEFEIVFSRPKQLVDRERHWIIPQVKIYSIKIKIENITIFGDIDNCNICLDSVFNFNSDTDKYISPCGHLFHLNCIINYLDNANLLYEIHPYCKRPYPLDCCNTRKIKQFNCPTCRQIIEK
jgi:hypothetical protein